MTESEFHRYEADMEAGGYCLAALEAILDGDANVHELYRTIYEYNDCGPWLSVRLHDGTVRQCDQLQGIENGNVRALQVGSIVEGSNAEVAADWIDLLIEDPNEAVREFNTAVEWVNDEVKQA